MVNRVMEGLKKPSGVKRSRAMMSPLSKNRRSKVMVDKKKLNTQKATCGFLVLVPGGEKEE